MRSAPRRRSFTPHRCRKISFLDNTCMCIHIFHNIGVLGRCKVLSISAQSLITNHQFTFMVPSCCTGNRPCARHNHAPQRQFGVPRSSEQPFAEPPSCRPGADLADQQHPLQNVCVLTSEGIVEMVGVSQNVDFQPRFAKCLQSAYQAEVGRSFQAAVDDEAGIKGSSRIGKRLKQLAGNGQFPIRCVA